MLCIVSFFNNYKLHYKELLYRSCFLLQQGRLREDKKTYALFLDIQKAYDTVWRDGLWYKLWDMGIKGRMWCVIKKMYMSSRNAVLLEGEKSDLFNVEQGVAQGCSLSPILFLMIC